MAAPDPHVTRFGWPKTPSGAVPPARAAQFPNLVFVSVSFFHGVSWSFFNLNQ